MAGKELTVTPSGLAKMYGGKTGSDVQKDGANYLNLNILQSDKQFEAFADGEDITQKLYGKLFVRSGNGNTIADLVDTVTGVLIQEQRGSELWVDGKPVYSSREFANDVQKAELEKEFGEAPKNVVKLLLRLDTPMKLSSGETIQYAVITIKGTGWGAYREMMETQRKLLAAHPYLKVPLSSLPVNFWRLVVKSKKVEDTQNGQKRSWYMYSFVPELLEVTEAEKYRAEMMEACEIDLIRISAVSERREVEIEEDEVSIEDVTGEADEKSVDRDEIDEVLDNMTGNKK
jgi:hypothetical protein